MTKFCTNCGNKLDENADVCVKCGILIKKKGNSNYSLESIEKSANTGFGFGLGSILAWILPLIGYPVTICGIIYSSKGMKSEASKGKAIAGLILSIIFLIATIMNSIAGVIQNLAKL
ncbi:MAG: zinc-ribbon domain-containing protein [Bacilli bacterium]|nr:zinc-ribbon domain-containing protein [Bacilli bacterium]